MSIEIHMPRGFIAIVNTPSRKQEAKLMWNATFKPDRTLTFNVVQKFVDSEVLRVCGPYIPLQTGMAVFWGRFWFRYSQVDCALCEVAVL